MEMEFISAIYRTIGANHDRVETRRVEGGIGINNNLWLLGCEERANDRRLFFTAAASILLFCFFDYLFFFGYFFIP
jgi:hypothetical protein